MNTLDHGAPIDMSLLQQMAASEPDALDELRSVLDFWREQGATAILELWEQALAHYDGAMPDEVSHHIAAMQAAFMLAGLAVLNPIAVPIIRSVDAAGIGPSGEEYVYRASPQMLKRGLAVDVPVFLRYPDGRLVEASEVRFTETAVKMLEVDLKASVRLTDPWSVQ